MPSTDEDVLRDLLRRATDDLHAPPAVTTAVVTRHHRRLRNARLLGVAAASAAAAAVVAGVVVTQVGPPASGHGQHPAVLTAAQVLDQLSAAAGRAPQPGDRYIALTEERRGLGVSYQRTTVFDARTGDVTTYQHGGGVPGALPVQQHFSPTRAEFAAWPTNPAKLRALLLTPGAPAVPLGETFKDVVAGETPDGLVFEEATGWLWDPLVSPALRAALYKVLAATPGVQVKTGTTDKIGRPATEVSWHDSTTGERLTTFESPSTGAVLEQDFSDAGTAVYTAVTGYATLPGNPYNG